MEAYRHEITDFYCAVIFMNKKTGKLGLIHNNGDENRIKLYWLHNEKDYEVLEIKAITNVAALKYFIYWDKLPRAYNNSEHRRLKFDFFKFVCGADLSDKYRDKAYINEVKEV